MLHDYFDDFLKAWDETENGKLSEVTADEFLSKYKDYEAKQEQEAADRIEFLCEDPPGCFQN